jgi:hypothetical protein
VVVIIEGTANVHFLLPMVVTTCVAKFVGNFFGCATTTLPYLWGYTPV